MTADEPFDLDAVTADDAMVERLRAALHGSATAGSTSPQDAVVWGDDEDDAEGEDLSYALLRALQLDVSADLDAAPVLPSIVPLRRRFGRTATIATVAAGVLSLTGVAAAATSSPGDAMYGVRSAVASAVHDAIDAITPSAPIGPAAPSVATPTAVLSPPGASVSTAARSVSAARQIEERIDTAERLLDRGRPTAAGEVLDQAQRRLPLVLDLAQRAGYQQQIDALRARAAAMPAPSRGPDARPDDRGKSDVKRPTPRASRTAPQQQRGQGGQESVRSSGTTGSSNRSARLPDLPTLPVQAEEHGAPKR